MLFKILIKFEIILKIKNKVQIKHIFIKANYLKGIVKFLPEIYRIT